MGPVVNAANLMTASRYLAMPAFAYWVGRGDDQYAMAALIACGVLDLLDGAVARALRCASTFGELFDAVTDAVCFGFFLVVLAMHGRLPWVPVAGILAIGAVNVAFRLAYARRLGRPANYRSYAMERLVLLLVFLAGFGVSRFEPGYFSWACVVLMAVVVAHDAKRMLVDPVVVPS